MGEQKNAKKRKKWPKPNKKMNKNRLNSLKYMNTCTLLFVVVINDQ